MTDRILFYPIAIVIGIGAWRLGFGYAGLGILMGLAIPIFGLLRGENFSHELETGAALVALGVACHLAALYFANKYGVSLEELDAAGRSVPKLIRRLPFYSITLVVAGAVVVIFDVLTRRDDK